MAYWKEGVDRHLDALGMKKGMSVKKASHQTGSSIKKIDKARVAMPPGKRISRYGKEYYELRRNRSDLKEGI